MSRIGFIAKKITALCLACFFCIALAACRPSAPPSSDNGPSISGGEVGTEQGDKVGEEDENTENGEENTPGNEEEEEEQEEEKNVNVSIERFLSNGYSALFSDPYMKNGFSLVNASGSTSGSLLFTTSSGTPAWQLAQWYSKYDLTEYRSRSYSKKGEAFTYTSKGIVKNGEEIPAKVFAADSTNASLYIELNAEAEYDAPRQAGEGWPHILLSQDFSSNLIQVKGLSELVMNMEFTVMKCEDKMDGAADPSLHCAQFVWYITLQNRTRGSAGYGQYIWFGLNLWDNRYIGSVCNEFAAQDLGKEDATLAFIYQPSGDYFLQAGVIPQVGEKASVCFDVLERAAYAYNLARSRGYLSDTEWEDVYVGGMNFGFEITGTYNAAVEIETVGVYYK